MSRKSTVLLYCPPPVTDKPSTRAPLALLAVAGPLAAGGYEVVILPRDPAEHEPVFAAFADEILCYGLSVMTGPQIKQAFASTRLAKEKMPHVPVVWGGWHPTIFPEQTARQNGIDIAVAGMGEDAMYGLVTCLAGKMSYRSVEGLIFQSDGKMINNGGAKLKDISGYPPFDYGLLRMEEHIFDDEIAPRTINYVSSRGCPKNCPSCAQSMVSGGVWRAYAPNRMIEDVLKLRDAFGVEGLLLDDANFFVDEARVREFAAGLINRKAAVRWGMPTGRLEELVDFDDGFWDLLRNSGLVSVFVGLEPRCGAVGLTRDDIYGKLNPEVVGLAETLSRHDIRMKLSVLIGFPPSDAYAWTFEEELGGAVELIEACLAGGNAVDAALSLYLPFPHAPLYDLALKAGLKPPASLEEWGEWVPEKLEMPWVPKGAKEEIEALNKRYGRQT